MVAAMLLLLVLAVAVAGVSSSVDLSKTCAVVRCAGCREVLDQATGEVRPRCLNATDIPYADNDDCGGRPLLVDSGRRILSVAKCGPRNVCPSGYVCDDSDAEDYEYGCCCLDIEKPGTCPKPVGGAVSAEDCESDCHRDAECDDDDKCCPTSCGVNRCQDPDDGRRDNPPPPPPNCFVTGCKAGERCVETIACITEPCPSRPVCEPIVPKKGNCPAPSLAITGSTCESECEFDDECSGDQKCCKRLLCGDSCQEPEVERDDTNPNCPPGSQCADRDQEDKK